MQGCYDRRVYIPPYFREDDPAILRDFMRRHSFALLSISAGPRVEAVHLPLLWRERDSQGVTQPGGVLAGHVVRANPIWQSFDGQREALAVFSGPHAYVSPRWYISRPQVPTWNYTTVHAYGIPRIVDEPAWIGAQLEELVQKYEGELAQASRDGAAPHLPWQIEEEPEYAQRLLPGIVAFEIPVSELQGKFKLNQNKSAEDRACVIARLSASEDTGKRALADLMRDQSS